MKIKRPGKTLVLSPSHMPHIRSTWGMWKGTECWDLSPEILVEPMFQCAFHTSWGTTHILQSTVLGDGCSETCFLYSISCFALGVSPVSSPKAPYSLFEWHPSLQTRSSCFPIFKSFCIFFCFPAQSQWEISYPVPFIWCPDHSHTKTLALKWHCRIPSKVRAGCFKIYPHSAKKHKGT